MKLLLALFACVVICTANAETDISGIISASSTWTTIGNPYRVTGNTVVNTGVKLSIDPGVSHTILMFY